MKTVIALLMLVVSLAGCSGNPIKAQIAGANIAIAQKRAEAAAKPILDASIPTPSGVMHIIVHAPQGAGSNGQIAMPEDPGWRTAETVARALGTGLNFWIGGQAAVGLVQATSGGIIGALKSAPDPVIVQPATPIVVEQPAPIIVEQPAPVIVTQPEPIIVPPTEPVIVNPVIVPAP